MTGDDERVLVIVNPKKAMTYRVTVDEDREGQFISLMQSNGFRFTKISEARQQTITVNLDMEIRSGK